MEAIYDWLEHYDFDELTQAQKDVVLSEMSTREYNDMRETLKDTQTLMNKIPGKVQARNSVVSRVFHYQIALYKVAAVVAILIVSAYLALNWSGNSYKESTEQITMVDTVYVSKTDTVFIDKVDTIKVKEVIYKEREKDREKMKIPQKSLPHQQYVPINLENKTGSCYYDFCPDDISELKKVNKENSLRNDSSLFTFTSNLR